MRSIPDPASLEGEPISESGRAEVIALFLSDVFVPARPWIPPVQGWTVFQVLILENERIIFNLGVNSDESNCALENIFSILENFDL